MNDNNFQHQAQFQKKHCLAKLSLWVQQIINMVEKTKKHLASLETAKIGAKSPGGRSRRDSIKLRKELWATT